LQDFSAKVGALTLVLLFGNVLEDIKRTELVVKADDH
jgi:hypothetical protein